MKVLIADDDAGTRRTLETAVRGLGHECVSVGDGGAAWEHVRDDHPDVVLTDRVMPGLDGLALCRRIRERKTCGYTYVVLITALGSRDDFVAGMEAGADDYLVKPPDLLDLRLRFIAAARVTAVHRRLAETASALEKANAELDELARNDRLTGVGNRRRFDEDHARWHAAAARGGACYGLLIVDIDEFKRYNDRHGHIAGDAALRTVAQTLRAASREADRVYRYGGEEFAVLLADTGRRQGMAEAAERLRAAVEGAAIPHRQGRSVVTVSVGMAACDHPGGTTTGQVLAAADAALYRAKEAGRNRMVTAG